jgi:hypothetical protein
LGGSLDSDRIEVSRTTKKEQTAPIDDRSICDRDHRHWLETAIDYHLGERPELNGLRPWFPRLVAEFFLAKRWLRRDEDPPYAIHWAKRFAAIGATELEVADALTAASSSPIVNGQGHAIFSRPDHLDWIIRRIHSRRRPRTAPAIERPPELESPLIKESKIAWQLASETDREQIRQHVRAQGFRGAGPLFETHCALELQRLRSRALLESCVHDSREGHADQ